MKRLAFATALLLVAPALCFGAGIGETVKAGNYSVRATFEKACPVLGFNRVEIAVADAALQPVKGARVKIDYSMPSLPGKPPMMAHSAQALPAGNGYEATIDLTMKGTWKMEVAIAGAQGTEKTVFNIEVR